MGDVNGGEMAGSGLKAGDLVEIRSAEEIFATLDDDGCLDRLPFMAEMLRFCGKRLRIASVAHKTCDTIHKTGCRSMTGTVHLEGLRCDGSAHGGCGAQCLLFWKESWLKPVAAGAAAPTESPAPAPFLERLERAAHRPSDPEAWRCQATQLFEASEPLQWWDPRQYLRDLLSRNVGPWVMVKTMLLAAFNIQQRWRGGRVFPVVNGMLKKTPVERLDLAPGELVQVKSKEEIVATLDEGNKNRGMLFDPEMLPNCGKTFRVGARVERIINERTGKMMKLPNECIILDGVACKGIYSRNRLFCPRAITPYWREIWLRRIPR
ncbi:MAG TPA: hypothetical protein VMR65_07915 [Candidatus Sulfotelmatobacter sp.]|jgi:hypothetical protein|nr:hypothetical protein [Candidatus Sulfotelmatobacter sp.]